MPRKTPLDPRIRVAQVEDAQRLGPLLEGLGYPATEPELASRLKTLMSFPGTKVLVAEGMASPAQALLGLIAFQQIPLLHQDEPLGRITALVVAPEARGRGIGRRLVEAVEDLAAKGGCRRIEVTSGEQRHDAHAFYRELGYESVSRRFLKSW